MPAPDDVESLTALLGVAGFMAAPEEAVELLTAAGGDAERLEALVARRLTGEPLAWIIGHVTFCGLEVDVAPGVYVPRVQTEALARRAIECLPETGAAIDLCTGSGAVAKAVSAARPRARVTASDIEERAVACAVANGVEAYLGDLFAPLPRQLRDRTDVVVGVVPYVPTEALPFLQRDTLVFESARSYDGGGSGTEILRRVVRESRSFLRPGGTLLLELGADQADALVPDLVSLGYGDVAVMVDEEGDVRGLEAAQGT